MIAWIQAKAWMIGGIAVALLLGISLFVTNAKLHQVQADRDKLQAAIYDERTGYIARLGQCHTNVGQLDAALQAQNASVGELKAQVDAATERANVAIAAKAASRKQAERDAAAILAMKPSADRCQSALSIIRSR